MTPERRSAATRLAASLFWPGEGAAPDAAGADERTFVEVAVRNKAPLGVVGADAVEAELPPEWRDARTLAARERERLETARREYTSVAHAWSAAAIPAVLIKSPGYFPYTSDNVDVLVPAAAAGRARSVLEGLGYRELPWVREPFKNLLRKVGGEPAGFAIHLHTRVAWINSFFRDDEVLDTSEPFGGDDVLRRPGPEMGFLITTAHWFYEDKEIKLRDLYHSSEILRREVAWPGIFEAAERGGWRDGLETAVRLLRRAAGDLGLGSLATRLPATTPPRSRLTPEFAEAPPVTALPARIERRKAKAMHFAKSLRNPEARVSARAREAALVGSYALKVRFPALQRAPLFVVTVRSAATAPERLRAQVDAAAATLRTRFSLPVEVNDDPGRASLGLRARGGIQVVYDGAAGSWRRGTTLEASVDGVRLGETEHAVTADDLALALARAYLESLA